jgi:hypothetical protein
MLRNGQLPERAFSKLLLPVGPRVGAIMWGFEGFHSRKDAEDTPAARKARASLLHMLPSDSKVLECWWDAPQHKVDAAASTDDAGQCGMARLMLLNALPR